MYQNPKYSSTPLAQGWTQDFQAVLKSSYLSKGKNSLLRFVIPLASLMGFYWPVSLIIHLTRCATIYASISQAVGKICHHSDHPLDPPLWKKVSRNSNWKSIFVKKKTPLWTDKAQTKGHSIFGFQFWSVVLNVNERCHDWQHSSFGLFLMS